MNDLRTMDTSSDERYMRLALQEAEQAAARDEVPVGALIVARDRIVGRGHNLCEQLHDFRTGQWISHKCWTMHKHAWRVFTYSLCNFVCTQSCR